MSTILILHCSAGAGHRSVARAIDEALTRCCESDEESAPTPPYRENSAVGVLSGETPHHLIADSLCFSGPPFRAMCSKGYEFFARHIRWACGMGYVLLDKPFSRSLLVRAVQKQEQLQLPNLRLILMDAEALEEVFAPGEVGRIYLNFSDPWPKERHAKRRLTSPAFLERYRRILAPGGTLEFKTDNRNLFAFSLESVEESGWELLASTTDLHHSELGRENILTEYEERFSQLGNPICKLIARPRAE